MPSTKLSGYPTTRPGDRSFIPPRSPCWDVGTRAVALVDIAITIALNSVAMLGPRRVRNFLPSTNTGAAGVSPVPGREMPISACLDSPGPLTMQPVIATLSDSTPGCAFSQ
jgi:hypothetical protein